MELVNSAVTTDRSGGLDGGDRLTLGWRASGGVQIDDGFYRYATEPGIPVVFPTGRRFTVTTPAGVHHLICIDLAFLKAVSAVSAVLKGGEESSASTFLTKPSHEGLQGLRPSVTAVATAAFEGDVTAQARLSLQVQLAEWTVRSFAASVERHALRTGKATVELAQADLVEHCGDHVALSDLWTHDDLRDLGIAGMRPAPWPTGKAEDAGADIPSGVENASRLANDVEKAALSLRAR